MRGPPDEAMASHCKVCLRLCCVATYLALGLGVAVEVGAQGTQGVQGTQGMQGMQGMQTMQGMQAMQGVQGTQGTQGLDLEADMLADTGPLMEGPGLYFNAGIIRTDNILRTNEARRADEVASVGAMVDLANRGPRLRYDVIGDLRWTDYLRNTYSSRLLGYFDGSASFGIVPNTFEWSARDTINQLSADPLQTQTPDQLVTENAFSTGPSLYLHPGELTTVGVSAQYGTTSSGDAPSTDFGSVNLDSDRYSGEATLKQTLSAASFLALGDRFQRVSFKDERLDTDYRSNEAYATYDVTSVRWHFALTGGYKQVHIRDRTHANPVGSVVLVRRITVSSTLAFSASQEVQESIDLSRADLRSVTGLPVETRVFQPAPTRSRNAGLAWNFRRGRSRFVLAARWAREDNTVEPTFNRSIAAGELRYRRLLRPTVKFDLGAVYSRAHYNSLAVNDRELRVGGTLTYAPGPRHSVILRYEFYHRDSTNSTVDFRESRVGVAFVYRIF